MFINRRTALLTLSAAALGTGLSACGGSQPNASTTASASASTTSAAASSSATTAATTFTLYSGRDEALMKPIIDAFTKETGITVDTRYDGTAKIAALLGEEAAKSPADVFLSQEAGALGELSAAGLLTKLDDKILQPIPAKYSSAKGEWVGLTARARVVVFDSQTLKEADVPGDLKALTGPTWKGKVGYAPTNASFQAFVTAMRVVDGEAATKTWLEGIKANDFKKYEKNGAILEAVNTGQVATGLINHYYWAKAAKAAGGADKMRAQLKFGTPGTVSALVNVTGVALTKKGATNAAAQKFVEFLTSKTAQDMFVSSAYEYALLPGSASPEGVPTLDSLKGPDLDLSELASLSATQELLSDVGIV